VARDFSGEEEALAEGKQDVFARKPGPQIESQHPKEIFPPPPGPYEAEMKKN